MHYSGTTGSDTLTGTSEADVFDMRQGGDDTVFAGDGNDTIYGGSGNDKFSGEGGDDAVYGGGGNDSLSGGDGTNYLDGGIGDDSIGDNGMGSTLLGGGGNDRIGDGGSGSTIDGGAGDDVLIFGRSDALSLTFQSGHAGQASDGTSFVHVEHLDLTTGPGNDSVTFIGTAGNSIWRAGGGDDTLTIDFTIDTGGVGTFQPLSGGVQYFDGTGSIIVFDVSNYNLTGGSGNDFLLSFAGNDSLFGNGGDDKLASGFGHDVLNGGAGNDWLIDSGTGSALSAGVGNDTIWDSGSGSIIDGGSGDDSLQLDRHTLTSSIVLSFRPGAACTIAADGTSFIHVEHLDLQTGTGNDSVAFLAPLGSNSWRAGGGDDTVTVDFSSNASGVTTFLPITGGVQYFNAASLVSLFDVVNYNLIGGSGGDFLESFSGDDTLVGNGGDDKLASGFGHDVLNGGTGNDWLIDSGIDSTLLGGLGNDAIWDSGDGSIIDGGSGDDNLRLDRHTLASSVVLSFRPGSPSAITSDGTSFTQIEHLDLQTGTGDDSVAFLAPLGSNSWSAGGGDDTVTIDFSSSASGVTTFQPIAGGVQYLNAVAVVSLFDVVNYDITGGAGGDRIFSFNGNDVLVGNGGNDALFGGFGSDVLIGGAGDDYLSGGGDADTISGGIGLDLFAYSNVVESVETAFDTITGFNAAQDKFDLWFAVTGVDPSLSGAFSDLAIVADAGHLGVQHAVLFSATDGQTYLVVDANGVAGYQSNQDLLIRLDGAQHLTALSTANFI